MGMQDRDYYRERWAKIIGHVEKTPFRLPYRPPAEPWHPVLKVLFTCAVGLTVYGLFRLLRRFF